ncbi:spindle pole body protein pcp1 [Biomphalaria pfeifferi]|uniref:Spindle pole body protein pcp1 n=1 Tax=Biomphalaria pfeifferi TaxID=112525 RepID=A0AAD8BTD6_BIOPF|nr:spindle pole body protein pcp1 [Biomphalaria pfeifferi]
MRPHIQNQIITLNLHLLENLRQNLVAVEDSLRNVLEKGQRWLEDDDDVLTFVQMNQFLVNENTRCLQTCQDIASGKEIGSFNEELNLGRESSTEMLSPTSKVKEETSEFQKGKPQVNKDRSISTSSIQTENNFSTLNEKIETVTKSLTKKIKSLQKRNTDQENFIQEITKNLSIAENKTNAKFDDLRTELHEASEFIHFQTEFVSKKVEKCEESNEKIISQQVQIENNYKENIENITKEIHNFHQLITIKTETVDELKRNLQETKDCNEFMKSESSIISNKLSQVETTINDVSKDIEKLKKDFTNVSKMESSNKKTFKKFHHKFSDVDSKIFRFSSELDTISQDIVTLKSTNLAESFSFEWNDSITSDVKSDTVVHRFNRPYNVDDTQPHYFDTRTGVYTAPCDGLYLICLMIENLSDYKVQFNIFSQYEDLDEIFNGACCVCRKDLTTSTVIPITLRESEDLYLRYEGDYKGLHLGKNSSFACLLIQKR